MPRPYAQPVEEQDPRYLAPMTPMTAGSRALFDNANTARYRANFARSAPPSTDPMVNRMRGAYVDQHEQQADFLASGILGPHYFQGRDFADAANDRLNSESGAGVGLINAQAGNVKANTNLIVPAQAGQINAQARGTNAAAANTEAMTPINVGMGRAQIAGQNIHNQITPAIATEDIADRQQVRKQGADMFPLQLDEAGQRVQGMRTQNQFAAPMLEAQIGAINRQGVLPETPVDPIDSANKRLDLAKKIGQANTPWYRFNSNSDTREALNQIGGPMPPPTARKLNPDQAREILASVGGDKAKARTLAQKLGFQLD